MTNAQLTSSDTIPLLRDDDDSAEQSCDRQSEVNSRRYHLVTIGTTLLVTLPLALMMLIPGGPLVTSAAAITTFFPFLGLGLQIFFIASFAYALGIGLSVLFDLEAVLNWFSDHPLPAIASYALMPAFILLTPLLVAISAAFMIASPLVSVFFTLLLNAASLTLPNFCMEAIDKDAFNKIPSQQMSSRQKPLDRMWHVYLPTGIAFIVTLAMAAMMMLPGGPLVAVAASICAIVPGLNVMMQVFNIFGLSLILGMGIATLTDLDAVNQWSVEHPMLAILRHYFMPALTFMGPVIMGLSAIIGIMHPAIVIFSSLPYYLIALFSPFVAIEIGKYEDELTDESLTDTPDNTDTQTEESDGPTQRCLSVCENGNTMGQVYELLQLGEQEIISVADDPNQEPGSVNVGYSDKPTQSDVTVTHQLEQTGRNKDYFERDIETLKPT